MTRAATPKRVQLHQVERAVIAEKWRKYALDGQLQVLLGEHTPTVINYCGRMVYVALACARRQGIASDDTDVRILRGATNALHDQVDCPVVQQERRGALISGVQAALRVIDRVGRSVMVEEALRMELLLRVQHISHSDFLELTQ